MPHTTIPAAPTLVLAAQTAQELMAANPISLADDTTVVEALAVMADRGIDAAPVINKAGLPVGVLTRTDLLIHEREQMRRKLPTEAAQVRDIMTPTVFTVSTNTPASQVVKRMRELNVHQLFVVDDANALVGVISAFEIVHALTPAS